MGDVVTKERRLSLAGRKPKISHVVGSFKHSYDVVLSSTPKLDLLHSNNKPAISRVDHNSLMPMIILLTIYRKSKVFIAIYYLHYIPSNI